MNVTTTIAVMFAIIATIVLITNIMEFYHTENDETRYAILACIGTGYTPADCRASFTR